MATSSTRLNKHIADSGLCSRRKADTLITSGNVRVNGKVVRELGTQIDPTRDRVTVHGKPLPEQRARSVVFYKPAGCLTTKADEKGRKTIYDFLPPELKSLDPAGRLDRNTSGVLILSNEGDFIHQITHPSFHVRKTYRVSLNKSLTQEAAAQLLQGVTLMPENKLAKVEQMELFAELPNTYVMRLITGYNRQIRRSLEMLGYDVVKLKRMSFGPVTLGDLKPGQFRPLKAQEKRLLLGNTAKKPAPGSKPALKAARSAAPKKSRTSSGATATAGKKRPEKRQDRSQNKHRPSQ